MMQTVSLTTTVLGRRYGDGSVYYTNGGSRYFFLISESAMPSFQWKKVSKFLKDQHKDDDVQSDEDLVDNTKHQVL